MASEIVTAPVYQQLNQILSDLVREGQFVEGQKFLTEREICQRFNVSRATANKALSSLVASGLLEFRKGVGTFVRSGQLDYDLRSLVSFTEKAIVAGKTPVTRVLRFERTSVDRLPPDSARAMDLPAGAPVYELERLRIADSTPVILERRQIDAARCPGLSAEDVAGSLYAVWTQRYRLPIIGAEQDIRAVNLAGPDAELLRVVPGTAGLLVTATGLLRDGGVLWLEQTLYRSDQYEFRTRLGGIRTADGDRSQGMSIRDDA